MLKYPVILYVDDDTRNNYFMSQNWRQKRNPAKAIILDDNPLSLALYMQDHPEFDFEDGGQLGPEDMEILKEMLRDPLTLIRETERKKLRDYNKMTAQGIVDEVFRR